NVILEALAVGMPVVISDIAMARQLLEDGENAIIVETRAPEDWSSRIVQLLDSLRIQKHLRRGGQALSQIFSVERMVKSYERLYDQLLKI
ncbi:MAG: glycosyltransferase, partial [Verrucomicrobiota bacterium]|nr:glycosyltransferase [Verrucomicrobiota bacterium]